MHPRRLCIVLGVLAAFAAEAAVVYKWTDADGVVHYSDQPIPGAEKIVTATSSAANGSGPVRAPPVGSTAVAKPVAGGLNFTVINVTSPLQDQTFFNDDVVAASLDLEPSLKPGQTVTWHLSGKELTDVPPNSMQFVLPHLDRGTYAIAATVTDPVSGESQSSNSVTFYVRQPSELSPQHKNP